jgi:[acyl-carrier-protein] S-malonyltransferase
MSAHGVTRFVELGAGKVLAGLIKRIVDGAIATSVGTPADVAAYMSAGANRDAL